MGTVGLSFGSPTSGTGFDVSATVSSIVANLQNVETPWKTQLTSLQSQDTVISSLGTLLSNLSNDVSNLTDFNGILAQKTGSSSDTNVLQLTAATSAATSGAHEVVINSLAKTSSGYLTEVGSASDILTGSITLSVGNGTPQQISLPSKGGTLSTLAAAINSSGAGISASVLTDSTGSRLSLVSGTSGANGNIVVGASTLSDTSGTLLGYSGTAGSSGTNSNGSLASITSGDTLSGSISIRVGSASAKIITLNSSNNTLQGLADAINGTSGIGVTATVSSDGTTLSFQSKTSGAAGTLAVTSNILDTDAPASLGYTTLVTGSDASLDIDGLNNLTSSSNTVSNLIPGLTFQLLAPSSTDANGDPTPVQVIVGNDNTDVESTIATMVNDYNSLVSAVNTQQGNDSSGKPEPMFGSPTLSLLQQQLLSSINLQNPNGSLDSISKASDVLSGTLSIQVGSKTAQTIDMSTLSDQTLAGLASAINSAGFGVTATVVTSNGTSTLTLQSQTTGSAGALTVDSKIVDSTNGNTALKYTNSSDISGLTGLGIGMNNDGSISLDVNTLDSTLNSDFNSVVGFFQSANSWGMNVATVLSQAGTSSSTGILKLAQNANSTMESNLNADISKEQRLISAQQKSLTAELNSANEILQQLPSQLQGVNELYSAITGYNQNTNG